MKLKKAKKKLAERIEAWEKMTQKMTSKQKMAFKKPGSMNGRK